MVRRFGAEVGKEELGPQGPRVPAPPPRRACGVDFLACDGPCEALRFALERPFEVTPLRGGASRWFLRLVLCSLGFLEGGGESPFSPEPWPDRPAARSVLALSTCPDPSAPHHPCPLRGSAWTHPCCWGSVGPIRAAGARSASLLLDRTWRGQGTGLQIRRASNLKRVRFQLIGLSHASSEIEVSPKHTPHCLKDEPVSRGLEKPSC